MNEITVTYTADREAIAVAEADELRAQGYTVQLVAIGGGFLELRATRPPTPEVRYGSPSYLPPGEVPR